jgi:ABC-2 type transport system permease protein
VRPYAPAVPRGAFPEIRGLLTFGSQVLGVAEAEVRKLRHDPLELLTRAIQPVLWLVIFGQVMAQVRGFSTGRLTYLNFLAPGVLAQSVQFIAIFHGVSLIWDRDLGILQKYLVSPAPRAALVLGKTLSASARALSQAVIVYLLAVLMRISVDFRPQSVLGVFVSIVIGASLFATLSMVIACLVKTRERFMGIGQMLTMPLFFASNAIYPLSIMPWWLRVISTANPLTYEVDALRTYMVQGGSSVFGLQYDFAVLLGWLIVLVGIASRLFPRLVM